MFEIKFGLQTDMQTREYLFASQIHTSSGAGRVLMKFNISMLEYTNNILQSPAQLDPKEPLGHHFFSSCLLPSFFSFFVVHLKTFK